MSPHGVNATGSDRVLLDLAFPPASVRAFDTFGDPVPAPALSAGLNAAAVPAGGYLVLTADSAAVRPRTAGSLRPVRSPRSKSAAGTR